MIIGISGKIGSGKDTIAKMIKFITLINFNEFNKLRTEHNEKIDLFQFYIDRADEIVKGSNWEIKRYADKVKDVICILIGCTREQLEDQKFKNKKLGKEWTINGYILTPRDLLQLVGTDCGRNVIHPDIWVNATMKDYLIRTFCKDCDHLIKSIYDIKECCEDKIDYPNWIIPDVRFINEAKAIEERGFVIRVNRNFHLDNLKINKHESETNLDNYKFKYVIENTTMDQLFNDVLIILKKQKLCHDLQYMS